MHRSALALSTRRCACMLLGLLGALLAGCGGGTDGTATPVTPANPTPQTVTAQIGPAGGTVTGADGVQVVIPAGALRADTTIGITTHADDAPARDSEQPRPSTVYAFTPHDIQFDLPVTVRMPVPVGSGTPQALFAASALDWSAQDGQLDAGFLQVQRMGFSWGGWTTTGGVCSGSRNGNPDWCYTPWGASVASAVPASALIRTAIGSAQGSSGGSYRLTAAASVRLSTSYVLWPSCTSARVRLLHRALDASPSVLNTLQDFSVALVVGAHPWSSTGAAGSTSFAPIQMGHLDTGRHAYAVRVSCTRADGQTREYGDSLVIEVAVPVPTVFHSIGGQASGLAGSGLVLRNNGGDDLAVAADGSFRFATPVGQGTPYAVTVASMPAGQSCQITHGSGTAQADVGNITVSCSTAQPGSQGWELPVQLQTPGSGSVSAPQLAVNASGTAVAVWGQDGALWAMRLQPGAGWGVAQRIDAAIGSNPQEARVAIDASGNAMVLWATNDQDTQIIRRAIWSSYYSQGAWASPRQIETGSGHAEHPDLGMDAIGNVVAVWSEQDPAGDRIRAARFLVGDGWSGGIQTIDGGIGRAIAPRVAVARNGLALAVWTQHDGTRYRIVGNRFNGVGWSTADIVDGHNSAEHDMPEIASDGGDNAMLVWLQRGSGPAQAVARRYSTSAGWSEAAMVLNTGSGDASDVRVTMNAQGRAMLVWRETAADVLSLHARGYGTGWDSTTTQIDAVLPASIGMGSLCLASDPASHAVAVWGHAASNGRRDLYGNRWAQNGAAWAVAVPVERDDSSDLGVHGCGLGMDASGTAIAVWSQADSGGRYRLWSSRAP